MEKKEEIIKNLKTRYIKITTILSKIELNILNNLPITKESEELLTNLSKLLEETFTHYIFQFFITKDYFKLFYKIRKILSPKNNEIIWKLYQYSQLIISNTKNSYDLNKIFKLEGFHLFFLEDEKYLKNDEIVDYFINIMKSIILKLDENSEFDLIKKFIVLILELNNHSDNLVKTTVSNIVLFLVRLKNKEVQNYIKNFPFLFHFLDVIRNIKKSIFKLDLHILKSEIKCIKNEIMNLQDNFHFIEEIIECAISEKIKNFVKNGFIIGIVIQTILPTFRQDLKFIKNENNLKYENKFLGINTSLFIINNIFEIMSKSGIKNFLIENFILEDKINYDIKEILNLKIFFEGNLQDIKNSKLIKKMDEINLLKKKTKKKLIFEMLISFMRSKDDNMILLTTNLFLYILNLENKKYEKNFENNIFENLIDSILILLSIDPSFRLITCKKLSKLLYLIIKQKKQKIRNRTKEKIIKNFKIRLENQKKLLMADHLRNSQISIFHNTALNFDQDNFFMVIKPDLMNWLSIFNYNFAKIENKELRYLNLDYKYDFNSDEYIEMEIKMMILFKNLRYFIDDNSVLMDYEKNIVKNYTENFGKIKNSNYYVNNIVEINFDKNKTILKKLISGKNSKKQNLVLCLFGRDLILFEKLENTKNSFKILSRDYYASFLYYFDRSNPLQINISSKKKISFWGILFLNVKSCILSKEILDKVCTDLKNMEFDFILKLVRKYEADCIY